MTNESQESAAAGGPTIHGTMEMVDGRVALHFELGLAHALQRAGRTRALVPGSR
jgi:hypothetical protein